MRHAVGLAEPSLFQLDPVRELVEQPTTPSEQDIDQVDPDLVHEARGEELLVEGGAHEPDPLVGGDLLGLREGRLDPVGDEREYRARARRERPRGLRDRNDGSKYRPEVGHTKRYHLRPAA